MPRNPRNMFENMMYIAIFSAIQLASIGQSAKGHVAHHRNGLLPFAHLLTDAHGSVATHRIGRPAELRHETHPFQSQRPALGTADRTAAEYHALGNVGNVGNQKGKSCGTTKNGKLKFFRCSNIT